LDANTLAGYFTVLLDLHRFRASLSDGLSEHPFDGMELDELLGSLVPTGEITPYSTRFPAAPPLQGL
jgi:hypothetical protein